MGNKIFGVISLVVVGIIVADLVIHGTDTEDVAKGVADITTPTESALLGTAPKS